MRLSWKLGVALVVVLAVVLGVQTWRRLVREDLAFTNEMVRDHLVFGRALRHAVEDALEDEDPESAYALVQRLDVREHNMSIRLLRPGEPSGAPPWMDAELAAQREVSGEVDDEDGPWRVSYVPVLAPQARGARIEIRESLVDHDRYLSTSLVRTVGWVGVLLASTAAVIGGFMWWMVLRPIDQLIAHARRIAGGDLDARVTLGAQDEIGDLGRELDQMAVALRTASERVAREQAAREQVVEQLRHADRLMTVGKLAAGVAHELGTPLNVALARARIIERWEVDDEAEARHNARLIAQQCDRMAVIIRQLLGFARPHALERAPTDLVALARQTLRMVEPMARKADVVLELVESEPVQAAVDPGQLQQVVLNVVTNALHASSAGGRVVVSVEPRDVERVAVVVSDQGTGMSPEELTHIFEPFFTTKSVGEGTGLGLSVSHGIVREHGGVIEVRSEPGEGSTFEIVLPRGVAG